MKSKMNKKLTVVAVALLLVVLVGAVAQAGTFSYNHQFTNTNYTKESDGDSTKNDGEDNWYITLSSWNTYFGRPNTMSAINIMGCRMRGYYSNTAYSGYQELKYAVTSKAYPYLYDMDQGDRLNMRYKKDDSSSSTSDLFVSGYVTP